MTELLLVRHGLPSAGIDDPGLADEGADQAKRLGEWLSSESITALVTSPYRRAKETADIVGDLLGLDPVVINDLREWDRDVPVSAYTPIEQMAPDDPRRLAIAEGRYEDFVPALDLPAFQDRVRGAFGGLFDRFPEGRVVVSSHGGAINAYLAGILDIPRIFWFNPGYTSISRVERLPSGRVVVSSVNETAHLVAVRVA